MAAWQRPRRFEAGIVNGKETWIPIEPVHIYTQARCPQVELFCGKEKPSLGKRIHDWLNKK